MEIAISIVAIGFLACTAFLAVIFLAVVVIKIEDDNAPECWRDL